MRLRPVLLAALLAAGPLGLPAGAVLAETAVVTPDTTVAGLTRTMQIDALFTLLREEGRVNGMALEKEMFPDSGGPQWMAALDAIYDLPRLRQAFDTALSAELGTDPDTIAQIVAFFGSPRGQRILTLEIEGRRTLLDEAAKEAAQVAADKMTTARDPRMALIKRLVAAGDLIEMNVAGAMSGNLAFMQGMAEAGAYGGQMTEDQMRSDVWGQEDQVRSDAETWLYPYLALAYQPLADADLQAYIDFSESAAGKKLNAALFTAFDAVFRQVSLDLGRAAGRAMMGTDI